MTSPTVSKSSTLAHSFKRMFAVAAGACALLFNTATQAQVGMQRQSLEEGRMPALLWYPTTSDAQLQRFGPFETRVAVGAPPTVGRHPLVIVSHGTGGHEMAHAWLAERLAARGYVVLSVRHPGDNFEDRSGVAQSTYFAERPRQLSRALDEVLADPRWAPLIDAGRIAAVGHSAGGHSVLALAGGLPTRAPLLEHCGTGGVGLREDAALCAIGGFSTQRPAPAPTAMAAAALPSVRDSRVRAVAVAAPLVQALEPASLQALAVPVHVEVSGRDELLAPAHHGRKLCAALPANACVESPEAGHFAFFQPVSVPMGPPTLDPSVDPKGFNRRAWQAAAGGRIEAFLGTALK